MVKSKIAPIFLCMLIGFATLEPTARGDISDSFDITEDGTSNVADESKTPEQLVQEGAALIDDQQLLDGRTKLLKALKKDPKNYFAMMILSGYYMEHVGHFRLAYRYIEQARAVFEARFGKPPYSDSKKKVEHSQILYLTSQALLNLDEYDEALKLLDEFSADGYYAEWYASSRAWVLMKLGRLEEATRTAKLGTITGLDPSGSYNMLGILLSMTGEKLQSERIFKEAIEWEMSLGQKRGQPATPMNNLGEVYREQFRDADAEKMFNRALLSHDGCQHILPTLNVVLLYLDQLKLKAAKEAVDHFESCVAEYTLNNGEEYRALAHLARGRIALYAGKVDDAIEHLEGALDRRQWFGKIGTSVEDLRVAATISLAQALAQKSQLLKRANSAGVLEYLQQSRDQLEAQIKSWWFYHQARITLIEKLNNIEDLTIRHTDSLLEYPTLGDVLEDLPHAALKARIDEEKKVESREGAAPYYQAYEGQQLIKNGQRKEGTALLEEALTAVQATNERLLTAHTLSVLLRPLDQSSSRYVQLAERLFQISPALLRGSGFPLPVNAFPEHSELTAALTGTFFLADDATPRTYRLQLETEGNERVLHFFSEPPGLANVTLRGGDLGEMIHKLTQVVFQQELQ